MHICVAHKNETIDPGNVYKQKVSNATEKRRTVDANKMSRDRNRNSMTILGTIFATVLLKQWLQMRRELPHDLCGLNGSRVAVARRSNRSRVAVVTTA